MYETQNFRSLNEEIVTPNKTSFFYLRMVVEDRCICPSCFIFVTELLNF